MPGPTESEQEIDFATIGFAIVDGREFFRDMIHTALTLSGACNVKHATTVEQAVKVLTRYGQEIGCVICEWDMAPQGGLDLLRMIRSRVLPKTEARTPVVIITSRANSAAVQAAAAMDVNGFAVAPLSVEKLVKTVTTALGRSWTLKAAEHYTAVPAVASSHAAPPPAKVTSRETVKRHDAPDAPAAAKPQRRKEAKLVNVRMCTLTKVKPGDIVGRDIKDREGHLMLSAGTELNSNLIARLKNVANGNEDAYHVWVGEWEAA
jgi:DNA-binding NarL/FixJ family response regulator